jgi:hypothetical protein
VTISLLQKVTSYIKITLYKIRVIIK